jgi:competence protein ComEC
LGWLAPLVNLVAVPVLAFWLAPLCLTAALLPPLDALCWELAGWPVAGFMALDGLLAGQLDPWLRLRPSLPGVLAGLAGLLWLAGHRALPYRLLALPLLLLPVLPPVAALPAGRTELALLDVGQGLALVLRQRDFTLVYDTGDGDPAGFNMASAVVQPFLEARGITRIDLLVISHADSDHASGVAALRQRFEVAEIWSGEPGLIGAPDVLRCVTGLRLQRPGLSIVTLAPWRVDTQGNNSSCVLRLDIGGYRVLLPGDIEAPVEHGLIRRNPGALAVDALLLPHHGSVSSTSSALLNATWPSLVLLSRGYHNRFGHPDPAVQRRLQAFGLSVCDTAEQGAILLALQNGELVALTRWREARRRYWSPLASPDCGPAYNAGETP